MITRAGSCVTWRVGRAGFLLCNLGCAPGLTPQGRDSVRRIYADMKRQNRKVQRRMLNGYNLLRRSTVRLLFGRPVAHRVFLRVADFSWSGYNLGGVPPPVTELCASNFMSCTQHRERSVDANNTLPCQHAHAGVSAVQSHKVSTFGPRKQTCSVLVG